MDLIRPGAHPAVVVPMSTDFGEQACLFGKSKEKQTPQVAVMFEILRGPEAGKKITWLGYFTDGATQRTLESLRIAGFTGEDLDQFPSQRPTNEVQLIVEHESYEGKTRAKVAWINDPNRSGIKMTNPLTGGDLRKFSAQFKSKLKGMAPVKTQEARREPPSAAPPPEDAWSGNDTPIPPTDDEFRSSSNSKQDDDIPF